MKYKLYTEAALAVDLPEHSLCKGDIVTVVEYHEPNEKTNQPGYSVEVFDTTGESLKVITVSEEKLQPKK